MYNFPVAIMRFKPLCRHATFPLSGEIKEVGFCEKISQANQSSSAQVAVCLFVKPGKYMLLPPCISPEKGNVTE
jgi:hypothetical protein